MISNVVILLYICNLPFPSASIESVYIPNLNLQTCNALADDFNKDGGYRCVAKCSKVGK